MARGQGSAEAGGGAALGYAAAGGEGALADDKGDDDIPDLDDTNFEDVSKE